uniref:Kelch domain-containing protein 10 n=1 Tax=Eptatretus burgeri TaxID=7764 RepID=A0A8C4Q2T0_EPTBU
GHRCMADAGNLFVFGGYNPDYEESGGGGNAAFPLFRELWRFHFATKTWQRLDTEGYTPKELASMSMLLHRNNLLTFGGTGVPFGESSSNDVRVCQLGARRWSLIEGHGQKPSKIYGQAMVIIDGFLYVFGGTTGFVYNTDLHRMDLQSHEWVKMDPLKADLPGERYRHEIAHDEKRIYVLGGGTAWMAFSLHKVIPLTYGGFLSAFPGYPAPRRCHSCVQIDKDVFVCGGYNGNVIFGDLWKLNLDSFQWTKLPAEMPEPAYFHCAAVTPTGCMYVHGGVVDIAQNRRTSSLYRVWLTVPRLLELSWECALAALPDIVKVCEKGDLQNRLGLSWDLIERLHV